jgi:hypothetical protein
MPFNPFSALTSKIFGGIAIFAITFGAIQTVRLDGFLWIDGVIEKLEKERAAHIATKVGYANAEKIAADLNKKQVEIAEQQRKELALGKDLEIRRGINAALADARRVWAAKANQSSAGSASAGEVATSPVDPNGAGGVSEFFTEDDVRICATNTMKAKGWQDFYEGLRAAE